MQFGKFVSYLMKCVICELSNVVLDLWDLSYLEDICDIFEFGAIQLPATF